MAKKETGLVDYSKPLKNDEHERFSQEYHISLNGTDAYKITYPKASAKSAEAAASRLLRNVKVVGRVSHLQAKRSDASGVTAERLMDEWKKIGFANIKDVVKQSNEIKNIAQMPDEVAASISSVTVGKKTTKVTMHSKETALTEMGKMIGAYEKDNSQKKSDLDSLLEAISGNTRGLPNGK